MSICRGWEASGSFVPGQAELQAPQISTASEARLARLEAKLAQLSAEVAHGAVAAPAAAKHQQVAPRKAALNSVRAAAAPVEQAIAVDDQGQQLWQQLLQTLQKRNKPQILACLQGGGRFAGLGSNHFHIHFNSSLMASLTMRNYRGTLEEILTELAGRPLQLVARGEDMSAASPPRPRASVKPEPVTEPELQRIEVPPEERPSILDAAVKVFGNNIVAVEEEN